MNPGKQAPKSEFHGVPVQLDDLPLPETKWIDAKGAITSWPARVMHRWVHRSKEDLTPELEFTIALPPGHSLVRLEGAQYAKNSTPKQEFVRFRSHNTSQGFTFETKDSKGRSHAVSLAVTVTPKSNVFWVATECMNLGYGLVSKTDPGALLYMGVDCRQAGDKLQVRFMLPPEAKGLKIAGKTPKGSTITTKAGFKTMPLSVIRIAGKPVPLEFTQDAGLEKPLNFSAGIGLSYLPYAEPDIGLSQSQLATTLKAGGRYRLNPKWSVGANIFGTLFAITSSPADLPSVRYLGINVDAGYALGVRWLGASWSVSGGMYLWTMLVSGKRYGLSHLGGPRALLSASWSRPVAPAYAYLKYAPISPALSDISPLNVELAIGGGYPIAKIADRFPVQATLDLSMIKMDSKSLDMQVSAFSASLGAQILF